MIGTMAFLLKPTAPFAIVRFQAMEDELDRTEWFWYVVDAKGLEFGDRGVDQIEVATSFTASTGLRLRSGDIPLFVDRRDQRLVMAGLN